MMCSFCCKQYDPAELKPMKNDDNENLDSGYCQRCLGLFVDFKSNHLWK